MECMNCGEEYAEFVDLCEKCKNVSRTDKEIIIQTNRLAREFYLILGYESKLDYEFQNAKHPQEIAVWKMACKAQEILTDTDVENCY